MRYVTIKGKRQRDPRLVLRVVTEAGDAYHVMQVADSEAAVIAAREDVDPAIHAKRDTAIRDALQRAEVEAQCP